MFAIANIELREKNGDGDSMRTEGQGPQGLGPKGQGPQGCRHAGLLPELRAKNGDGDSMRTEGQDLQGLRPKVKARRAADPQAYCLQQISKSRCLLKHQALSLICTWREERNVEARSEAMLPVNERLAGKGQSLALYIIIFLCIVH